MDPQTRQTLHELTNRVQRLAPPEQHPAPEPAPDPNAPWRALHSNPLALIEHGLLEAAANPKGGQ